jgi:hypothetical protein
MLFLAAAIPHGKRSFEIKFSNEKVVLRIDVYHRPFDGDTAGADLD